MDGSPKLGLQTWPRSGRCFLECQTFEVFTLWKDSLGSGYGIAGMSAVPSSGSGGRSGLDKMNTKWVIAVGVDLGSWLEF